MNSLVFICVLVAVSLLVSLDGAHADQVPDTIIPEPRPTILGLVSSQPDQFGILARAAAAVPNLPMTLDDPSARLTVFAPTDEAFTALTRILVGDPDLNADDKDAVFEKLATAIAPLAELEEAKFSTIASILAFHVLGKPCPFQRLENDGTAKTLQGDTLEFISGTVVDKDSSRDNAVANPRNILVQNGWVHVIDSVLLPFNIGSVLQRPAEAGDGSLKSENDGPACFPGSATVRHANGSSLTMSTLKAGDKIHVGNLRTSRVFAFTHKKASQETWFYSLETASGHKVTLTGGHYIYVNGALVATEEVRIGEILRTEVGNSPVVAVRHVRGRGLFAPHTIHGDIEVDGILVSGYSCALHPTIAHGLLAPLRALAEYAGVVEPLGSLLYNGADPLVPFLPKGRRRYRKKTKS